MDVELIVHIGQPKAGSTSIQRTLEGARAGLDAQGAFYLGLMGEHAPGKKRRWQQATGWTELAALGAERAGEQLGGMLEAASSKLAEAGARRLIWSNESILGNDAIVLPVLERLADAGARVRVVVYVRRPDTWAQSAYMQWGIKDKQAPGEIPPFREWLAGRHKRVAGILEPWVASPRVETSIRNFDACGDVVADFLACAEIDPSEIAVERAYETPNAVALALWAMHNGQSDDPVPPADLGRHLQRSGLLANAPRDVDFSSLVWSEEDIAAVWRESARDRAAVNRLLEQAGQPPFSDERLPTSRPEVSQNQLNAALLTMIKRQGDQILALRRQLRRLQDQLPEGGGGPETGGEG